MSWDANHSDPVGGQLVQIASPRSLRLPESECAATDFLVLLGPPEHVRIKGHLRLVTVLSPVLVASRVGAVLQIDDVVRLHVAHEKHEPVVDA